MEKTVHIAFQCSIFMDLTITEFHNCGWNSIFIELTINLKLLSFEMYVLPSETPVFSWHVLRTGFIISRNSGGGHFIPKTIEKFSQKCYSIFFFSILLTLSSRRSSAFSWPTLNRTTNNAKVIGFIFARIRSSFVSIKTVCNRLMTEIDVHSAFISFVCSLNVIRVFWSAIKRLILITCCMLTMPS